MTLPYDHIACIDYETYYDDELSLKKMATTDYVRDERFEAQTCAIKMWGIGEDPNAVETVVNCGAENIGDALRAIDWSRTAFLAHHAQFDGLISTHHFGVYPCFWLDTLSMARMVFGVDGSVGLKALCERLGRPGKVHGAALVDVKGKHLVDMTNEELDALCVYNGDDVDDTAWVFSKLSPLVPEDELKLIDITVRMYAEPVLLIDGERVEKAYHDEVTKKAKLFEQCGIDAKTLGSATKFAAQLEALGVNPPMKVSFKQKNEDGSPKLVYAFAKNDYEFKGLLEHDDERVRWLVEARLASKSSLVETRAQSILRRVGRPTPVYLNYYGARTGRWSGGDGVNWQNLPKRGIGGELRKSLVAPEHCLLIVSDAAQIEARTLAWHAGQQDILDTFASGQDVYCLAASMIYGRLITEADKQERFVGKVFTLGAGYGAGAAKINYMLKIGAFGPPVHQTLEETQMHLRTWRQSMGHIVQHWKSMNSRMGAAFINGVESDDGVICFEGFKGDGYMHLPNGAYIKYPKVHITDDDCRQGAGISYTARNGDVRLYGGIVTENATQALARIILGQQMLWMQEEMPDMRIANTTHDEVLLVVPERKAQDYADRTHRIMSTTPDWAEGLPLNAETTVSLIYEKT